MLIGGSASGKGNSLFNLIIHLSNTDNIYLYAKDPYEAKYQLLIKKQENKGLKHFNSSTSFIENLTTLDWYGRYL